MRAALLLRHVLPDRGQTHADRLVTCAHLEVPVHEPFAVQKVHRFGYLEEDLQTLVVLPLLREAALSHPVLQVLLPTELHLDVQIHLRTETEVKTRPRPGSTQLRR